MNKDRGVIKWTAMMLPEHVKLLREWQEEDALITQPQLDEAQLEQINLNLQRSYAEHCPVHLKIWEQTSIYTISGIVQKISAYEHCVKLKDGQKIQFDQICDVSLDE